MERPISKPPGTPVNQLDTPSLIIDIAKLEHNIEVMHSFFRNTEAKLRPRIDSHGSAAIAHKQIAAGGTVGGISVMTLGQAEVFAQHGFTDIFIVSELVTRHKITRLCLLARSVNITVAVDSEQNVRDLSEAAAAAGVTLDVVIDVDTGLGLCGVQPGIEAVSLAHVVTNIDSLRFVGLTTSEGKIIPDNQNSSDIDTDKRLQSILDTRESIEKAKIDVSTVSTGSTTSYRRSGSMNGITEIRAGSYTLMDNRHLELTPEFTPAATVMTTVTSTPQDSIVITDGGIKSIGGDNGDPRVINVKGATVQGLSAEHVTIQVEAASQSDLRLGDKVCIIPMDIAECVNLHDYLLGVRGDSLEAIWNVTTRGHYR